MSAPTIPASTESRVIVSETLNAETIIAENITDGVATLSGGFLSNLNIATNPQEIARRSQLAANTQPGGDVNDVQYNENGFAGNNNFDFTANVLSITGGTLSDQTGMSFNPSGIISGAVDPVANDQAATKNFVDGLAGTSSITTIESNTDETWTAAQMYGVIIRNSVGNLESDVTVTDTTPSAADIIANFPGEPSVGSAFRFNLLNDNFGVLFQWDGVSNGEPYDLFNVLVNPGAGVTFSPTGSFRIPRTHTLDAFVIFDNITPGSEAVTIHINSIDWFPKTFFFKPQDAQVLLPGGASPTDLNIGPTDVLTGVFINQTGTTFTNIDIAATTSTVDYTYTETDTSKGFINRNPAAASSDTISNNLINRIFPTQQFRIMNTGTDTISITPQDGLSYFQFRPTLTAGGTGYTSGIIYTVTGGSGAGMNVQVNETGGVVSEIFIYRQDDGTAATRYSQGDVLTVSGGGNDCTFTLDHTITIPPGTMTSMSITMTTTDTTEIVTPGSGYAVGPTTVTGGSGTGFAVEVTGVISGAITGAGGSGYTTGLRTTTALTGGGSGLTVNIFSVDVGGAITTPIFVEDESFLTGLGYANGDLISVDAPGTGAVLQILIGAPFFTNITDYGVGYQVGDTLTLEQAGSSNDATINITDSFYSVVPYGNTTF